MAIGLLDWISDPSAERGLHFARDKEGWDFWSYARVARAAHAVAAQLQEANVRRGEVAAIVMPSGPAFVAAHFATLLLGLTPTPLIPPTIFEDAESYVERTAELLAAGIDLVVTEAELVLLVESATARAGLGRRPLAIALDADAPVEVRRERGELALLQFTSGSSGRPRAVEVGFDSIEANIHMIRDWISWGVNEGGTSWLPLYHDMGLIGCVLPAIMFQRDGWLMRPEHFVVDPLRWLERLASGDATLTAAPTFAFSYCVSKVRPEQLDGLDFSRWRVAIVGAERLDPYILRRFVELLGPHGFRPETIMPAYGLAEATLAVTLVGRGTVPRAVRPDWHQLAFGDPVRIEDEAALGDDVGDGHGWLVGCGGPLPGVTLEIVDEEGRTVPDGSFGEIRVAGRTVARGYRGETASLTRFTPEGLLTGDAGFMLDGKLHVVGRLGDALNVRGRTLYAEDLEAKLTTVPEVPVGRCIVLPSAEGETGVVAIVERAPGPWIAQATQLLLREAGRDAHIRILTAERGTILRTSSGKPRRRMMWRALLAGQLAAIPVDAETFTARAERSA